MDKMAWLGHFGLQGLGKAGDALTGFLASHAPDTATAADRAMLVQHIADLAGEKVTAAESIDRRINNPNDPDQAHRMGLLQHIEVTRQKVAKAEAALQVLKGRHDVAVAANKPQSEIDAIIAQTVMPNAVIDACEKDLELDTQMLESAREYLAQTEALLREAQRELGAFDSSLRTAKLDDVRATRELEMAEQAESRQRRLAGMSSAGGASTIALRRIQERAEAKRHAAAVSMETANALAHAKPGDDDALDQIIASANPATGTDPFARLNKAAA
jgi:hypothetical protein